MFSVVLDYGDHASVPPAPQADQPWPLRPDPFSAYRAGFEVRTYRRVQRLLFFNNFPDEPTAGADCLVRSLDLVYSDQQAPPDPRNPVYTFLVSVTQTGYRQGDRAAGWSPVHAAARVHLQPAADPAGVLTLDPAARPTCPKDWAAVSGGSTSTARGCPGSSATRAGLVLQAEPQRRQPGRPARRDARGAGRFGPLETVAGLPSRSDLSGVRLLDLSGSGRLDVVDLAGPDPGFFERTEDGTSSRCSGSPRCRRSTGRTRTSSSSTSPATGWPTS